MEDNRTFSIFVLILFFVTFGAAWWVLDGAPIPTIRSANKEVSTFQRVTTGVPKSVRVPNDPLPKLPRFERMAKIASKQKGRPVSADDIAYNVLNGLNDVIVEHGKHYLENPCKKPIRVHVTALVERHFLIKARHPKLANNSYVRPAPTPEDDELTRVMAEIEPATTDGEVIALITKLVQKGLLVPNEFSRVVVDKLRPYATNVGSGTVEHIKSCQAANSTE